MSQLVPYQYGAFVKRPRALNEFVLSGNLAQGEDESDNLDNMDDVSYMQKEAHLNTLCYLYY